MTNSMTQVKATEILDKYSGGVFPVPVVDIANSLGIKIFADSKYPADKSGHIELKDGVVRIIVNDNQPATRIRFTIAHEIAHAQFDMDYLQKHGIIDRDGDAADNSYRHREQRANDFAARLLMPEEKFVEEWIASGKSIEKMAEYFNVSKEAARIRAINLGLITE